MPNTSVELLAKVYHEIIKDEILKKKTTLAHSEAEILNIIRNRLKDAELSQRILQELKNMKWLISIGDGIYRSLHLDMGIRVANTRPHIRSFPTDVVGPLLEAVYLFKFSEKYNWEKLKEEILKDRMTRENIERMLRENYNVDVSEPFLEKAMEEAFEILSEAYKDLRKKYLSKYQYEAIKRILGGNRRGYIISAPTGSGKTLIFRFVTLYYLIIIKILLSRKVIEPKGGVKILMIYPRKSLESDQMGSLLGILYEVNEKLKERGIEGITLAIDDGDTRKIENDCINENEAMFRGISCPLCNSPLKVYCDNGAKEGTLRCASGSHEFNFVKVFRDAIEKEVPDILITNVWTYYLRLTKATTRKNYWKSGYLNKDLLWLILDECHSYRGPQLMLTGAVFTTILHYQAPKSRLILSSATIPKKAKEEFVRALSGLKMNEVELIDHDKMVKEALKNEELREEIVEQLRILFYVMNPQIAWETLSTEAFAAYLMMNYSIRKVTLERIKLTGINFIDSVRDLIRVKSILRKALELGSPWDRVILGDKFGEKEDLSIYYNILEGSSKSPQNVNKNTLRDQYLDQFLSLIGEHYGEYIERSDVERKLKAGDLALVFATSTLELGVDYNNVSFIFTIGRPIGGRCSIEQRIGRAGRDPKSTLRTTVVILFVRNRPSDLRFYLMLRKEKELFDEILGKELKDYFQRMLKKAPPEIMNIGDFDVVFLPKTIIENIEKEEPLSEGEIETVLRAIKMLRGTSNFPVNNLLLNLFRVYFGILTYATHKELINNTGGSQNERIRKLSEAFISHLKNLDKGDKKFEELLSRLNLFSKDPFKIFEMATHKHLVFQLEKLLNKICEGLEEELLLENKIKDLKHKSESLSSIATKFCSSLKSLENEFMEIFSNWRGKKGQNSLKNAAQNNMEIREYYNEFDQIFKRTRENLAKILSNAEEIRAEILANSIEVISGFVNKPSHCTASTQSLKNKLGELYENIQEVYKDIGDLRNKTGDIVEKVKELNSVYINLRRLHDDLHNVQNQYQDLKRSVSQSYSLELSERILLRGSVHLNSPYKSDLLLRFLEEMFGTRFLGIEIAQKAIGIQYITLSQRTQYDDEEYGKGYEPVSIILTRYPPFEPVRHPWDTEISKYIERTGFWILMHPDIEISLVSPKLNRIWRESDTALEKMKRLVLYRGAIESLGEILCDQFNKDRGEIRLINFTNDKNLLKDEELIGKYLYYLVLRVPAKNEIIGRCTLSIAYPLIYVRSGDYGRKYYKNKKGGKRYDRRI